MPIPPSGDLVPALRRGKKVGPCACDAHGPVSSSVLCYGHGWGLLFVPVHVVTSSFGSDLPGPVSEEPPFVLSLFPTGVPGNVQLELGPAAVYVPPAAVHSCAGEAAYPTAANTKIAAASTTIPVSETTNRFMFSPLNCRSYEARTGSQPARRVSYMPSYRNAQTEHVVTS